LDVERAPSTQGWLPVGLNRRLPVPPDELMAGRELGQAFERAQRGWHVAEAEVVIDRRQVDSSADGRVLQQALELGCKGERAIGQLGVDDRLLSQTVAGQKQALLGTVPDR